MQWLTIISGSTRGKKYPLKNGNLSVGREASSNIQLESPMVSRLHSTLEVADNEAFIIDHGSSNGTLVNGSKVDRARLRNADKIYIGNFVLEYSMDEARPDLLDVDTYAGKKPGLTDLKDKLGSFIKTKKSMSWKLKLFIVLFVLTFLGGILLIMLVNSKITGDLNLLALSKGEELVRYLAEKNKLDLANGNEMLLDADSVREEKGIKEAVIVDRKGTVLAPLAKHNQTEKDPFLLEALNIESDKTIKSSKLSGNLYVLAHPIRSYNPGKARYETIGAAKIVFAPDELVSALPAGGRISYAFLIIFLGVVVVAYFYIKRMTLEPLKSLADKTEQARIDGNFESGDDYPEEFKDLAQTILRLSAALQSLKPSAEQFSESVPSQPKIESVISNEKIDSILSAIPEPCLIFDNEKIILSINEEAEKFLGREISSSIGRKISEIIPDRKLLDAVEDSIEESSTSTERIINKTVEIGLKTYEISLTGVKDHTGHIEFGTLIIEKI